MLPIDGLNHEVDELARQSKRLFWQELLGRHLNVVAAARSSLYSDEVLAELLVPDGTLDVPFLVSSLPLCQLDSFEHVNVRMLIDRNVVQHGRLSFLSFKSIDGNQYFKF